MSIKNKIAITQYNNLLPKRKVNFEIGNEPACKECLKQTKRPYRALCNNLGFVTRMKKCDLLKSEIQFRVSLKELKEKFNSNSELLD